MFQDRDWSASSPEELIDFLDVHERVVDDRDALPWDTIAGRFADVSEKSIPWEWLAQPELELHYTGWCAQGLLWGFLHPREASDALDTDRVLYSERAPEMIRLGLRISREYAWATNEDFYQWSEELVRTFEAESRPLADTPAELLAEHRLAQRLRGAA